MALQPINRIVYEAVVLLQGAVNGDILFLRVHQTRVLNAGKLGSPFRGLVEACNPYMECIYWTLQNHQESCRNAEPRPKPRKRPNHRTEWGNVHNIRFFIGSSVPVNPPKAEVLPDLEELEALMKVL